MKKYRWYYCERETDSARQITFFQGKQDHNELWSDTCHTDRIESLKGEP
ncbi:hypothetical protein BFO01nite_29910 [Brevibacillus formosus]|uniref:Uncharacterized protein n=1 Tax=Brevibacillus formosus TaxID=54913 RepID=A0ABQ0T9N6_9BACL|nr:hypothetical protein BFO01nite_29910 [Brevibacillus formosus]